MSFLLPKGSVFFELFRQLHGEIGRMSTLFGEFAREFDQFESYAKRAHEIENSADEKAHRIVEELNRSFITPLDREDIHYLAYEMDDIVDLIENVIRNAYLYRFTKPIDSMPEFAACMAEATEHLGKLLEALEAGKHTKSVTRHKIRIHEIEDRADILFEQSIIRLFERERDPITVIKTKDVLEEMENVVDKFQTLANLIESTIIKMN